MPSVPYVPHVRMCLTCLRALRAQVPSVPACLRTFASHVLSFFYLPYVLLPFYVFQIFDMPYVHSFLLQNAEQPITNRKKLQSRTKYLEQNREIQ